MEERDNPYATPQAPAERPVAVADEDDDEDELPETWWTYFRFYVLFAVFIGIPAGGLVLAWNWFKRWLAAQF